tara:strand:+ start:364 stop:513 length:150 start_codon:yes stop_codon:yes gene_type:complete
LASFRLQLPKLYDAEVDIRASNGSPNDIDEHKFSGWFEKRWLVWFHSTG